MSKRIYDFKRGFLSFFAAFKDCDFEVLGGISAFLLTVFSCVFILGVVIKLLGVKL